MRGRILICVAAAAAFGALLAGTHVGGVSWELFVADAAAAGGGEWWYGALSTFGLMLWAVMFGCCVLCAALLRSLGGAGSEVRFFAAAAAAIALVACDDALQLHEGALYRLGVPELPAYAAYVVAGSLWVWRFGPRLWARERLLLAVSGTLLVVSAGIDAVGIVGDFEEYLKAVGLVVATAYWILAAHAAVLVAAAPKAIAEPDVGRLEKLAPTHH